MRVRSAATDDSTYFFIVNPKAGLGGIRFSGIANRLRKQGVAFAGAMTMGAGDARLLARMACNEGFRAIVVIGGDGTFNEVLNGLATDDGGIDDRVALALLPSGTAQDLARGLGLPLRRGPALSRVIAGEESRIDVGRITFGDGRIHFFANVVGAGLDAEAAGRAAEVRGATMTPIPSIPSIPAHLLGFASALAGYQTKEISIAIEDEPGPPKLRRCNLVVVANGPSYAGMMQMAPQANFEDGLLNVIVIGDVDKLELILNIPRVMSGSHLAHDKVAAYRARSIALDSADGALLQADGELVGQLPARIEVLPGALRVIR